MRVSHFVAPQPGVLGYLEVRTDARILMEALKPAEPGLPPPVARKATGEFVKFATMPHE